MRDDDDGVAIGRPQKEYQIKAGQGGNPEALRPALRFGIRGGWRERRDDVEIRLPIAYFEKRHIGDILLRFTSIEPIRTALDRGSGRRCARDRHRRARRAARRRRIGQRSCHRESDHNYDRSGSITSKNGN